MESSPGCVNDMSGELVSSPVVEVELNGGNERGVERVGSPTWPSSKNNSMHGRKGSSSNNNAGVPATVAFEALSPQDTAISSMNRMDASQSPTTTIVSAGSRNNSESNLTTNTGSSPVVGAPVVVSGGVSPAMGSNVPNPLYGSGSSNSGGGNSTNNNAGIVAGSAAYGSLLDSDTASYLDQRRQKRLERNRESARLSRRRRKQYLEVLEERVSSLSEAMDAGRRQHVADAVATIRRLRHQVLSQAEKEGLPDMKRMSLNEASATAENGGDKSSSNSSSSTQRHARALLTTLSRCSDELRIAGTFQKQQVKSFVSPPHTRFMLWLTLQNECYFRGGREANERLSAARIGERMLHSGNDTVAPANGMWPLLCNEIALSYDQEEKLRNFQRALLANPDSWLHRHTLFATTNLIQTTHKCIDGLSHALRERDNSLMSTLSPYQQLRFLLWARKNQSKVASIVHKISSASDSNISLPTSPSYHKAANLYLLDRLLHTTTLSKLPIPPPLVPPAKLKKFGRRPSFESLACPSMSSSNKDFSSDSSFHSSNSLLLKKSTSSSSLKRPSSSISNEYDDDAASSSNGSAFAQCASTSSLIIPEAAQALAASYIVQALKPAGIPPVNHSRHYTVPAPAVTAYSNNNNQATAAANATTKMQHHPSPYAQPPPQHTHPSMAPVTAPTAIKHPYPDRIPSNINPAAPPQQQPQASYSVHPQQTQPHTTTTYTYPVTQQHRQNAYNHHQQQQHATPHVANPNYNSTIHHHHQPPPSNYHHNPASNSSTVPSILPTYREGHPMKVVPEESTENINNGNHNNVQHPVVAPPPDTDFLLDLADDWAIEGFDIEIPSLY